jgi:heterodisulfide reductase subunit C
MPADARSRLLADPAGKTATKCFTCGMCVAGCPVGYHAPEYNLVQNLWDAYYRDELSPTLWWCATCYTCQDRCPHDVHMVEIIFLLQQLYAERYGRPAFIDSLVKLVEQSGYMGQITPALNRRREAMGLPLLLTDIADEIGQLLEGPTGPHNTGEIGQDANGTAGHPSEAAG